MKKIVHDINDFISTRNLWDWRIASYTDSNLVIQGSFDFCYYIEIEIIFSNVFFIKCPTYWTWPTKDHVSITVIDEITKIRKTYSEADEGSVLFLIHADADNPYEVVATNVSAKCGKEQ